MFTNANIKVTRGRRPEPGELSGHGDHFRPARYVRAAGTALGEVRWVDGPDGHRLEIPGESATIVRVSGSGRSWS